MRPGQHIPPDRLTPDAADRLTSAQRAHLQSCAQCRVQVRLLARAWQPGRAHPESLPPMVALVREGTRSALELSRLDSQSELALEAASGSLRVERLRCLGSGPTGVVFEVRDRDTRRHSALKLVHTQDPHALRTYATYCAAAARLAHPNVAPVQATALDRQPARVFTRLLTGVDLRELAAGAHEEEPNAPDWDAVRIAVGQAALGLGALHDAGLVHGNLKPSNVLLDQAGRALLVDGGQGLLRGGGSDRYSAPEVVAGQSPEPASDWFSLGTLLLELLAGTSNVDLEELTRVKTSALPRLAALCLALRAPDPRNRAGLPLVLSELDLSVTELETDARLTSHSSPSPLPVDIPAPLPAQPSRLGPYPITGVLARGGMGVVYRARDEARGTDLAIKTVRSPRPELLDSVRREIAVVARLDHPGLVRVLDHGVADGLPWYAMPYVYGAALSRWEPVLQWQRGLSAGAPDPPALVAILRVMGALCEALSHLHAAGLVHRDLKPANVIVTPAGQPVIVDFGLSSSFAGAVSREVLEVVPGLSGTLPYMAPEQIRGELLDARADLYAVGCVLHELVTGKPPFQAESSIELLFKQLNDRPAWARDSPVPEPLRALIDRLLAKRPADRLGYADDVAQALAAMAGGADAAPEARPVPYLYAPSLAGRQAVLRRLDEVGAGLQAGHGAVVLISGESGIGKTRLALEWLRRMARRGCDVMAGSCVPPEAGGSGALGPLRNALQTIADRCRAGGAAETHALLGTEGPVLAAIEPSLADTPGFHELTQPDPLPAAEARDRIARGVVGVFARQSRRRPLLLVLDDLQWADGVTLAWLALLSRTDAAQRGALVVVGLVRPEEQGPALRALQERDGVLALALDRLDDRAVAAMIGSMLALQQAPEPSLVRFVCEQSGGVPFFVSEYIRLTASEGVLVRDHQSGWRLADARPLRRPTELPVPSGVRGLLERRLERLDPPAQAVAEVMSVMGRPIAPALLEQLAGAERPEVVQALVQSALVVLDDDGRLRFTHRRVGEVAYDQIEAPRRLALHLRAAEVLEGSALAERASELAERARHWRAAARPDEARARFLQAARAATVEHDLENAARCYAVHLELVGEAGSESVAVRLALARVLLDAGAHMGARDAAQRAVEEALALGLTAAEVEAHLIAAEAQRVLGQREQSMAALEAAARHIDADRDPGLEARRLSRVATLLADAGQTERAVTGFERALELHRAGADAREEGVTLNRLAAVLQVRGELDRARGVLEAALQIHRTQNNRRSEGVTLHALGLVYQAQGLIGPAQQHFADALAIERAVGDRRFEGLTLTSMAAAHLESGENEAAERLFEHALEIHREVGSRWAVATTETHRAVGWLRAGSWDDAAGLLDAALETHRALGNQPYVAYTEVGRALLARLRGDLAAARAALAAAGAALDAVPSPFVRALWWCERGQLTLLGGGDAAAEAAEAALLAASLGAQPTGELGRAVAALNRARRPAKETNAV